MAVAAPTRPLVLPDTFDGSGDSSWEQWIYHFDNVATVNAWSDENKLKWLKVRLTGRAQTAFQRLPEANRATFTRAIAALKERFEPATRKHRYLAELQTRRKRKGENWADFADDLKSLADKAYPDLQEDAREQLALNCYLAQLDHPQVAFGVKQKNLDAAVSATLELEAYATPKPLPVLAVEPEAPAGNEDATVGAVNSSDKLADILKGLSQRLDKLECRADGPGQPRRRFYQNSQLDEQGSYDGRDRNNRRRDITCFNCGKKGHIARFCYSRLMQPPPPMQPLPPPHYQQPQDPRPTQLQQQQPPTPQRNQPHQTQGNWGPPV